MVESIVLYLKILYIYQYMFVNKIYMYNIINNNNIYYANITVLGFLIFDLILLFVR